MPREVGCAPSFGAGAVSGASRAGRSTGTGEVFRGGAEESEFEAGLRLFEFCVGDGGAPTQAGLHDAEAARSRSGVEARAGGLSPAIARLRRFDVSGLCGGCADIGTSEASSVAFWPSVRRASRGKSKPLRRKECSWTTGEERPAAEVGRCKHRTRQSYGMDFMSCQLEASRTWHE